VLEVNPGAFGPALWNIAALLFAVSGYTIWISAAGCFRWRVLGLAVFLTLLQFLVNLLGQLWDVIAVLRPFTVFYYYQPQQIILQRRWTVDLGDAWNGGQPLLAVNVVAVLTAVGVIGYGMALWTFRRRDLPAPL
jgi:ABC-2 type transport system permease protein